MIKTSPSNVGDVGSIPGQGAKSPTCLTAKKNLKHKKQKQWCNKFNKDFKIIQSKKKRERERENAEKWLEFGKGPDFDQQNSKHSTSFPKRSFGMLWGLVVMA